MISSPIIQGEDGTGAVGLGAGGFEFVDPNEDPELALVNEYTEIFALKVKGIAGIPKVSSRIFDSRIAPFLPLVHQLISVDVTFRL